MHSTIEHGGRGRRIGAIALGAALTASVGLAAAHFAGFQLPFSGETAPSPITLSSEPAAVPIGGPMTSTQVLQHRAHAATAAATARHAATAPAHVASPPAVIHHPAPVRAAIAARPRLAVAVVRHDPPRHVALARVTHTPAPVFHPAPARIASRPKALTAVAHHLAAPPARIASSRIVAPRVVARHAPAPRLGVCANAPRPDLCLRRLHRERRGDYDSGRPGDGSGRGDGMGWRRRGGGYGDGEGWRRGGGGYGDY